MINGVLYKLKGNLIKQGILKRTPIKCALNYYDNSSGTINRQHFVINFTKSQIVPATFFMQWIYFIRFTLHHVTDSDLRINK